MNSFIKKCSRIDCFALLQQNSYVHADFFQVMLTYLIEHVNVQYNF